MARSTELRVVVSPGVAKLVEQAVAQGGYASTDEILAEALLEWSMRRPLDARDRDALSRLWKEGIESGPGQFASMDEIKREAQRLWAEQSRIEKS